MTEAEETEPLLARHLFDAARKADGQEIPQALEQAEKLAEAGFADEASKSSRRAGEGICTVSRRARARRRACSRDIC